MGTLKITVTSSNGKQSTKEVQLAEETPLRGLKNGSKIQLVAVAINELGTSVDTNAVRAMVCKQGDNGIYPQYLLGYKNGTTPVIVPISAIGRAFDDEEFRPNDLTAQLSEASGYNALVERGAVLKTTIRRGLYTYLGHTAPTSGTRSILFEEVAQNGSAVVISGSAEVEKFIELLKSAREFASAQA